MNRLHAYMMNYLQQIMAIQWEDKVTNIDVLKRANLPTMADILIEKNLRWLGHVHRMVRYRLRDINVDIWQPLAQSRLAWRRIIRMNSNP